MKAETVKRIHEGYIGAMALARRSERRLRDGNILKSDRADRAAMRLWSRAYSLLLKELKGDECRLLSNMYVADEAKWAARRRRKAARCS